MPTTPVTPMRLLLVDDDVVDRLAARRALASADLEYELVEAEDAAAARAALRGRAFDCVLLDLRMPRTDGLALLRELRAAGETVPVVMLTGQGDEQTAVEIMKAGALDYIAKNALSPARIAQSLRHVLRVRDAEVRAESARREVEASERRYRFLAESIPQVLWTSGPDGRADYFNQRMYEYTGVASDAPGGPTWDRIVHPADLAQLVARWNAAVASGAPFESQTRLRRHDGTYRWHLARARPLTDGDGAVIKWFGTATDIDDEKQAAEALDRERMRVEEANRAKDVFLAMVSHELRTPLTAMLGWLKMLRSGLLAESKRDRALETIERNARAQAKLVEDLLDVSRVMAGKLQLESALVDLAEVVESALETVRPSADARGVLLEARIDRAAGLVHGDASRLAQVVTNLLTNAVKFTPRDGRVFVELARDDAHFELTVRDTGRGIRGEFLPRVFEPFLQAEAGDAQSRGGLGLGLAIVRQLVELHGGAVEATSEGEGRGACFLVRLPRPSARGGVPATVRRDAADGALGADGSLRGLRVLVVDDEDDARELVAAVLAEHDADVSTAGSAAEALAAIARAVPDVIVSDVAMPGGSGYELIRSVRRLAPERGGATPAIALTALARAEDRVHALAAGFTNHASKPIDPAELVVVVASVAGRLAARTPG